MRLLLISNSTNFGGEYLGYPGEDIKTTNDMPVVEPDSFGAFNLVPFQINPHYTDSNLPGHAGETREQRIEEFIEANPGIYVAGLREGTLLLRENDTLRLFGSKNIRIFKKGSNPVRIRRIRRFVLHAPAMRHYFIQMN